MDRYVKTYDTSSTDYKNAFQVFLAHTDEKKQIHRWLSELVAALPARNVFIDAGAGNGQLTGRLQPSFKHTIAIEPSPALRTAIDTNCPRADVVAAPILSAEPSRLADLVLCSHVLYYIPEHEWLQHLERLASWLSPTGVLAVVMQSHDCDCTELLCQFTGKRPNLLALADAFRDHHSNRYLARTDRALASIATNDFASAYTVAEFMLNLLPGAERIPRAAVEEYVTARFKLPTGDYRLSLDQDFLSIRRRDDSIPGP
jgi:SAM-dependent methyltransferase